MKDSQKLYLQAIAILATLVSCSTDNTTTDNSGLQTIYANFSDNKSKTSLQDEGFGSLIWNAGDAISVFESSSQTGGTKFITKEGGITAEFVKADDIDSGTSNGEYVGLYPYSSESEYKDGKIKAEIPASQTTTKGNYDPNALLAVGKSTTAQMGFYNVCGGIRFTLSNSNIDKVVFRGNNNEILAGKVSVNIGNKNIPSVTADNNNIREIELETKSGNGDYFYLTFIPQTFTKGFEMDFYFGGTKKITTKCNSEVTIERAVFGTIKKADTQEAMDNIISGGEDLSVNGTANCYIVSKAGTYKFPLVKGNSATKNDKISNAATAEVLWETDNTASAVNKGQIIKRSVIKGSYVFFETPATLKSGNALIAVRDANNKIIWSWHIWICQGYNPVATGQTYKGKSTVMMDRNLGALSSEKNNDLSCGLLYQWGRKDPFMGAAGLRSNTRMASTNPYKTVQADNNTGTVEYGIEHPNTYIYTENTPPSDWHYSNRDNTLWSTGKTKYDPCPPGWKVPQNDITDETGNKSAWWHKLKGETREEQEKDASEHYGISKSDLGAYFNLKDGGGQAWYPLCGYLACYTSSTHDAGTLITVGQAAFCWSVTTDPQYVNTLKILNQGSTQKVTPCLKGANRAEGRSVRCVKE